MHHKNIHTAIVLFANSPEEELKQKNISGSKNLYEYFNEETLSKAKQTGLDVLLFSDVNQVGKNFGERFSNAIESIFKQGYDAVITIGNDTPDLKTEHLLIAKENLQHQILTLGPSMDGGSYLITLSKSTFNKEEFQELPWQSNFLFTALENYLTSKKHITKRIEVLKDIDETKDLFYFINRFRNTNLILRHLIFSILFFPKEFIVEIFNIYTPTYSSNTCNKGSPFLFIS
ncbi:hypothetical protein EV195_101294 [Tenacibaculum skagerrakense]|uniref:DUF2064 domain-containing protein n=1 Tax=Tenacibaculum skagerrakense TaxID=186571 RepID=A0A4R2P2F6_9FLAO|nr:DUF2064 domain-containing protein [Tenacibaculum skagerrakense]TCP28134.1 hypothetical protein EV195_101294 [Tenacibaculum skagerrakense]